MASTIRLLQRLAARERLLRRLGFLVGPWNPHRPRGGRGMRTDPERSAPLARGAPRGDLDEEISLQHSAAVGSIRCSNASCAST